ncbi:MAG TPA: hypothetical protein VMU03_06825, partial [Gammaproteobacteria bacterium]|nr:hypothetical protein [Gammaproteobacteria bacterium]
MRSISMSTRFAVTCTIAALALCAAAPLGAQPPEKPADQKPAANLDLTMTLLLEHAKGPEEITRHIELPPPKA